MTRTELLAAITVARQAHDDTFRRWVLDNDPDGYHACQRTRWRLNDLNDQLDYLETQVTT